MTQPTFGQTCVSVGAIVVDREELATNTTHHHAVLP